ncbi:hypothetical protein DFH07DRAFT_970492 [Mycena maculata]|uniref:Uncharacterized protein n=1 Tax=Mycena maculata TaxID=230809 RepID=A0AAD7MPP9_9AGAR|nr:hypothetical protein DFH07DRAFT_970492 [Mycena maculata]
MKNQDLVVHRLTQLRTQDSGRGCLSASPLGRPSHRLRTPPSAEARSTHHAVVSRTPGTETLARIFGAAASGIGIDWTGVSWMGAVPSAPEGGAHADSGVRDAVGAVREDGCVTNADYTGRRCPRAPDIHCCAIAGSLSRADWTSRLRRATSSVDSGYCRIRSSCGAAHSRRLRRDLRWTVDPIPSSSHSHVPILHPPRRTSPGYSCRVRSSALPSSQGQSYPRRVILPDPTAIRIHARGPMCNPSPGVGYAPDSHTSSLHPSGHTLDTPPDRCASANGPSRILLSREPTGSPFHGAPSSGGPCCSRIRASCNAAHSRRLRPGPRWTVDLIPHIPIHPSPRRTSRGTLAALDDVRSLPEPPFPRHALPILCIRAWIFAHPDVPSPRVPTVIARPPVESIGSYSRSSRLARALAESDSAIIEDLRLGTSYNGGMIALSPCLPATALSYLRPRPPPLHIPSSVLKSTPSAYRSPPRRSKLIQRPVFHRTTGASVYGRSAFPMDAHPVHPPGANASLTSPPDQQIDPFHSYSVGATRL